MMVTADGDAAGSLEVRAASHDLAAAVGALARVVHAPDGRPLGLEDLRKAAGLVAAADVDGSPVTIRRTELPHDGLWVLELAHDDAAIDALQDRLDLFAGVLDEATDLYVTIVDRDLRHVYANRAYREGFAFARHFAVGRRLHENLSPAVARQLAERYTRIMDTGLPEIWERVIPSSSQAPRLAEERELPDEDHVPRTLLAHSVPIRSARTGQVVAIADAALEITDRLRAVQKAQSARDEAERAKRAMSELVSRVSHELRTPLHAMLGFGQLLQGGRLDDESARHVERIVRAGRHLDELINDVLEIGRQQSRSGISSGPVAAAEVVGEALESVASMAETLGIRVVFEPAAATLTYADHKRLRQILINLLSNALRHNRPGGRVEVSVEAIADRVRFVIRDSGRGIATQNAERIFLPFERLDAEQADGTGLGLTVARTLAEAMGGTLRLASSSPEGSTFVLDLAAAEPTQPRTPASDRGPALAFDDVTVLHVDDSSANSELVDLILARAGVLSRLHAATGETAIALAVARRPDVILLDAHLPDRSGLAVLEALRAEETTAGIPVVMVTADTAPEAVARFLEAGVHDVVRKPFAIDGLLGAMGQALAGSPSRG